MEGLWAKMGSCWRRRKLGYVRINESSSGRRRFNQVQLGSTGNNNNNNNNNTKTKRKIWRIKIKPKFRLLIIKKLSTPKKWLLWLRDSYVNMMLGVANSRVMIIGCVRANMVGDVVVAFGKPPLKDYDEKMMMLEIYYKSVVLAQNRRQLVVSNEVPRLVTIEYPPPPPLVSSTKLAAAISE